MYRSDPGSHVQSLHHQYSAGAVHSTYQLEPGAVISMQQQPYSQPLPPSVSSQSPASLSQTFDNHTQHVNGYGFGFEQQHDQQHGDQTAMYQQAGHAEQAVLAGQEGPDSTGSPCGP